MFHPRWGFFTATLASALFVCGVSQAAAPKGAPPFEKQGPSVVVYGEHILRLSRDGKVHAWRTTDLRADAEYARALAGRGMALFASGNGELWATDLSRIYRWSPETRVWEPGAELPPLGETVLELVVAEGRPVVVYVSHVADLRTGKVYPVPKLGGALQTNVLRALAVQAIGSRVWIGTGYGEWGGHLVGLDLTTGQWVQYADVYHDVTGIAGDGEGNVWVSWSMSHMFAHARLRLHRPDATVAREYPKLESHYVQTIAWDEARRTLYGVDLLDLVRFEEGKPVKLTSLGALSYGEERNAVGVAPGITRLEVLGPERLLIVHETEAPIVYAQGALITLPME